MLCNAEVGNLAVPLQLTVSMRIQECCMVPAKVSTHDKLVLDDNPRILI